jgi:Zn-dependent peptidase ImmA (M78 family)
MAAGERFVTEFKLGDIPATRLAEVMERELGVLVLMVDTTEGVSGAGCRLPELDVVLINRYEVAGRRHFDLAHELFHVLTWDAMPPQRLEDASETGGNRIEQLANNFASAVLMPIPVLDRFGDWSVVPVAELPARLNAVAQELQVTSSALKWRLVALDRLKQAAARAIPDVVLRNNGREQVNEVVPPLFSQPFMEVINLAIDAGRVSMRRAAGLLDLTVEDLRDLFVVHGLEPPADL